MQWSSSTLVSEENALDEIYVLPFKAQLLLESSTNKGFIYNCTKNECEIVNLQFFHPALQGLATASMQSLSKKL